LKKNKKFVIKNGINTRTNQGHRESYDVSRLINEVKELNNRLKKLNVVK